MNVGLTENKTMLMFFVCLFKVRDRFSKTGSPRRASNRTPQLLNKSRKCLDLTNCMMILHIQPPKWIQTRIWPVWEFFFIEIVRVEGLEFSLPSEYGNQ